MGYDTLERVGLSFLGLGFSCGHPMPSGVMVVRWAQLHQSGDMVDRAVHGHAAHDRWRLFCFNLLGDGCATFIDPGCGHVTPP